MILFFFIIFAIFKKKATNQLNRVCQRDDRVWFRLLICIRSFYMNCFRRCFCEEAQQIGDDGSSISNLTGRRARTGGPRSIRSVLSGLGSH